MLYNLTTDFIKINETKGTVQNTDNVFTVEVADKPEINSGFLLYPLNKISFSETVYLRCTEGAAQVRVVPFNLDEKGGDVGVGTVILNGEEYQVATNAEINAFLDSLFKED